MRDPTDKQSHRAGGLAIRLVFTMAVAAVAGCGEHDATAPEERGLEPASADATAPDLGSDASAATPNVAGSSATAALTRLPRSFFVNPHLGNDANLGTNLKPFKTLAHGLSLAIAGDTMRLAIGVYSAATNGEKFTNGSQQVVVPAGVLILGTPGEAISQLQGVPDDLIGLDLKGAATVRNLIVRGFRSGIRATQGVQTLKSVVLDQNILGLELSGSAKTTLATSRAVLVAPSQLGRDRHGGICHSAGAVDRDRRNDRQGGAELHARYARGVAER